MIAAQEWYEYQKQYQKYGIDMRPKPERVSVPQRRKQQRKNPLAKGMVLSIGGDHGVMLSLVLIGVLVLMMVVVIASYSAKLTYDINKTKAENDVISGEIEDLDVKMLSSSTITYIEGQAKGKLGMNTPDSRHCVYITAEEAPEKGFADILKEKAYE
ncbi:MAG: cell division protein FtsL [Eubacteriales bacterium]|nr:cell division protein FtsL [Eubacteriales bacterium]